MGGRVFLKVFKVFVRFLLVFCQVCRSTRSQTAGRPTGIPIRDPQVTTVPLPVRNIGGSVSTHRQKGKNRQATLTGSYFRSVGAPKRQPLFRECDCEPDCEVMGSRSFLAWVWTCISIQPSSVGPVWSLHDTHQAKDACMNHRIGKQASTSWWKVSTHWRLSTGPGDLNTPGGDVHHMMKITRGLCPPLLSLHKWPCLFSIPSRARSH